MFGQAQRLPVEFLVGRVDDYFGKGGTHEWVQEHPAQLQVAHEGAQKHLQAASDRIIMNSMFGTLP